MGVPDLSDGVLQAARLDDGAVSWVTVPDPVASVNSTRHQIKHSTPFDGGEGILYRDGSVYIATKGDNRIWRYDIHNETVCVHRDTNGLVDELDGIAMSPYGDLCPSWSSCLLGALVARGHGERAMGLGTHDV